MVEFDSSICRLCAEISDSLVPIFDVDSNINKSRVDLKIKKCFPTLLIDEHDSKPKQICITCMSKLDVCNDLFDISLEADSKFNTFLNRYYSLQESKGTVVETCVIKQTSNCLWPSHDSKSEKTLTVQHDGGVIVLSKMESDILNTEHQTNDNRDFVVMVELKYKEPDSLSDDRNIISNSEPQIETYNMRDKLESLVAYTQEECSVSNDEKHKQKLCDNPFTIQSELKDNGGIQTSQLMLFEPNTVETSKEKCLRLITNNSNSLKRNLSEKPSEHSKKGVGAKSVPEKKVFVCSICSKQFRRRTRLNSHMAVHTEIRPHSCDQCNESFVMRWDLTLHQRIHSRTFECEFCKKIFTVRNKLDRHLRTHTGERPHVCGYCCKSFSDKRNLDNHLRTHTGEKPYICSICNRSFRVRTHLTEHQRVHTKETPYRCETCGKTFRWRANYNVHIKMHIPTK